MPTTTPRPTLAQRCAFIREQERSLETIAQNVYRHYGTAETIEDVRQVVALEADKLYFGYSGQLPDHWRALLHNESRSTWRDEVERSRRLGVGGVSGRNRRRRGLKMSAAALRVELGREPTVTEILEHHNAMVGSTRSDARKQGAVATEADFQAVSVTQAPFDQEAGGMTGSGASVEDEVVEAVAVEDYIHKVVATLSSMATDAAIIAFAQTYLSRIAEGSLPSAAELAADFAVSESMIARWVHGVRKATFSVSIVDLTG
ncbi:MAG: hypothetical protein M0Z42_06185 [Actinomycetota bacterium]|nr:hypothetical protein [Actinomycetota bacterium]